MRYIKIENYVERYTMDNEISVVDWTEEELQEKIKESYLKEIPTTTSSIRKFYKENRKDYSNWISTHTENPNIEELYGKLEYIEHYLVYLIAIDNKLDEGTYLYDIVTELNTKYGLVNIK